MEITHAYAQNIVEKTTKIFDYNINIMNSLGIIVGSGDRKRIDTYHRGAAEIIDSGKPMEITSGQAKDMEGVKPGVNLPIFLHEKIAGVVGITGEPDEVRPYGQLLKISVETMLMQFYLSEQLRLEQNAKELYISDIINGSFQEDGNLFLTKGSVLGFDMTVPRCAVIVKIYDFYGDPREGMRKREDAELAQRRRWEKTLGDVKMAFRNSEHMISPDGSSNYVIFFALEDTSFDTIKRDINKSVGAFKKRVSKFNIDFRVGVGSYYPGLSGLKRSYREGIKVLQITDKMKAGEMMDTSFAFDLSLEMMLAHISDDTLKVYIDQILSKDGAMQLLKKDKLLTTLKVYFASHLNISRTAETLMVTRNTVSGRLNKIKTLTGLEPCDFNDAVRLKVLLSALDIKGNGSFMQNYVFSGI